MFPNKLFIVNMLNILAIKALNNENSLTQGSYKTLQTGSFYLNSERPLWILQDQKDERVFKPKQIAKEQVKYEHFRPLYYHNRQQPLRESQAPQITKRNNRNFKTQAHKRLSYINNYQGLQLPRNYIPLRKSSNSQLHSSSRRYQNSKFLHNMPVFDAVPGDETYTQSHPIFIYTGNKGRMLLNTMLSKRKYPMQEPVPGQVLYPPQTLVFKPQPIVENFQQQLNVTMIPFYAYEAIDPRHTNDPILTTTSSSLASPFKSPKKYKKSKQYSAFFSPQEVLQQPVTDHSQYHYHIAYTTNPPPTLETPYNNHRFNSGTPITTTPLPHKKFEVTYNDGEDKFQITYEDDTPHLERPINVHTTQFTTTQASLPYESYTIDKNYYAFPLYTMGKLMEKEDNSQSVVQETTRDDDNNAAGVTVERQTIEKYIDTALKEENNSLLSKANEDTWFILNSRYKGPLKTNVNNLHSSKYIHTTPVKVQDDLDLLKTTTTNMDTTKTTLQAQQRSFYGDNSNFI